MKKTISRVRFVGILAAGLGLLPLSAEETKSTYKLSDWKMGETILGETVKMEDLKGKVVVLEHWGVNCPPCIESLPHLAKLDKRHREKGLRVIGAESQSSSLERIKPVVKKAKIEFPITRNASGPIKFSGIPKVFVFNAAGDLVFDGNPHDGNFERSVRKALKEMEDAGESTAENAVASDEPLFPSQAWTNSDGKEIQASVIKVSDTSVTFRMANGKDVEYPLDKLSAASRAKIEDAGKSE